MVSIMGPELERADKSELEIKEPETEEVEAELRSREEERGSE